MKKVIEVKIATCDLFNNMRYGAKLYTNLTKAVNDFTAFVKECGIDSNDFGTVNIQSYSHIAAVVKRSGSYYQDNRATRHVLTGNISVTVKAVPVH